MWISSHCTIDAVGRVLMPPVVMTSMSIECPVLPLQNLIQLLVHGAVTHVPAPH